MVRPPEPPAAPTHPRPEADHAGGEQRHTPTGPQGHLPLLPVLQGQVLRRPGRRRLPLLRLMVHHPRALPPLGRRLAPHHHLPPHIHREQRPPGVQHLRHHTRRPQRRPERPFPDAAAAGERVAVRDGEGGERDHGRAGQVAGGGGGAGWGRQPGGEDRRTGERGGEGG